MIDPLWLTRAPLCTLWKESKHRTGATTMRDHDPRQLTIALTAIVIAWSIAFALTYASRILIALTRSLPDHAVAWVNG